LSQALSVQQFEGKEGYAKICGDWRELMRSISSQYLSHHPAWFHAFFDRPTYDENICFRCVFEGTRLIAVCPMVFKHRFGRVLCEAVVPAHETLSMPDMAIADSADPYAVWQKLSAPNQSTGVKTWDRFTALSVLETSTIASSLRAATDNVIFESNVGRCAVIDIVDYDEAMKNLRKKFRGNLNNAKNRLAAQKSVEFLRVIHGYPAPAAIGLRKSKYLFYKNVIRELSKTDSVEINLLKVNGKTVGAQIYAVLSDRSFLLKTAFSEDSREFSPGHVLLDAAYRRYAQTDIIKQMCLISDYDWFKYWNPRYVNYLNIKAFRNTVRGRIASKAYSILRKQ
jgi:CelD/BcsL family acetyltransferase involved in cellulose biosynthesis